MTHTLPTARISTWRRRLGLPLALVALAVTVGGTAFAVDPPAGANPWGLNGSAFEVRDGNTAGNGPLTIPPDLTPYDTLDWDGLNRSTGESVDTETATVKADVDSGRDDNSFGNGTKEDTAVPSVVKGSIPPNKSDLKEFGSWVERNPNGQFLHLFWSRVQDPSGTTNMDFEFNRNACVENGQNNVCSANGVTPVRSDRDLLITYDLSNGGSLATVSYRRWSESAKAWGAVNQLSSSVATGSINGGSISSSLTGNDYGTRTFGEASVDTSQIFSSARCESFGSAYLKSRSSDSFTSALKDFISPVAVEVSNCGGIRIEKHDDSAPAAGAVAGATFAAYSDSALTTPVVSRTTTLSAAVATTTTTSVTVAEVAGISPGTLVRIGAEWMRVTSVNSTTKVLTVERGANRTATAATTATSPHAIGATVSVIASCTTAGDHAATAPASGRVARCTIPDLLFGSYWVVETKAPAGYQINATSFPASPSFGSPTIVVRVQDNRAPATIKVTKVDDAANPLGGAVFRLYADDNGTAGLQKTAVAPAVADTYTGITCTTTGGSGPAVTADDAIGTCRLQNILTAGSYVIHEHQAPAGFDGASDKALTVALGQTYDLATISGQGAFVNTRRYTVIVLVCRESDSSLYASSVNGMTTTGVSSPSGSTGLGTSGPTEAELCGADGLRSATGTSAFGGKHAGTHSPNVVIPTAPPSP